MPPTVSVVIPVLDAARTIEATLISLRRQTFEDFDVVVVDDGSTDDGPARVAAVARSDRRFRLVDSDRNRGVAAALNLGLAHSDAPLVARLDADDEAEPQRLAAQVAAMQADPELVVCGSTVRYLGRGRRPVIGRVPLSDSAIREELDHTLHSPFFHPAVLMRRSALDAVGGYREEFRNAEDYDLWLRLQHEGRLLNLETPLTRYRVSPRGATLGRLREQRRYALLARRAAETPDRPLVDVLRDRPEGDDEEQLRAFVAKEQQAFAVLLADLGHPVAAAAHLLRVRDQVGARGLPGFLVGRARGAARRLLRGA